MIRLRDIRVDVAPRGRRRTILELPELVIEPGERVAIVGPSGCGKTTLLSLIAGLRLPTAGTVTIAGQDLALLSGHDRDLFRARHVSVVFQAFNLLENSPAHRNIALPLALTDRKGPAAEAWVQALLERVGLAERREALPRELSTGERQRLAVARALAAGVPILLADEPTSNLDPENAQAVLTLLLDHAGPGRILLTATHDHEILSSFSRIVKLEPVS